MTRKVFYVASLLVLLAVILVIMFELLPSTDERKKSQSKKGRTLDSSETEQKAVEDLIVRLLPNHSSKFVIIINRTLGPEKHDTFRYTSREGKLVIEGSNGVAASTGFYHFLKYRCSAHVSWSGNQLKIPSPFPEVKEVVRVSSPYRYRYYQNVCTSSYSYAWWNWSRWEREIDWMALNGINLPLAFTGQEAIWLRVYKKMGLTQEEIDAFFGGPAFLAWTRMGNIHGWGGPLPASWYEYQRSLQHKIVDRMRSFGMTPVLPAFNGYVPRGLVRVFPNANITKGKSWGNFKNPKYCCTYLLDIMDPLFQKIGKAFIQEQIAEYGTNHIYNTDTFNENLPHSKEPSYLSSASKAVFEGIIAGDPNATWLMQGWLFYIDRDFWQPAQVKALLSGVPYGRLIILDLFAEANPVWKLTEAFYGHPFIWCMLENFGGNNGLFGAIDQVSKGPVEALNTSGANIIGTGLTPEGIGTNDIMYELMNEMGWRRQAVVPQNWTLAYFSRRYGNMNAFIRLSSSALTSSVYNCTDGHPGYSAHPLIVSRPSLVFKPHIWYEKRKVFKAWDALVATTETFRGIPTFRYDLVDVTREVLQQTGYTFYKQLVLSYHKKSVEGFTAAGSKLLKLFDDMDSLLSSNKHFLLGRWLNSARALGNTEDEKNKYEYNARNQITLWGPNGELHDYANKQWAGLVKSYYKPRWELFISKVLTSLKTGKKLINSKFQADVLEQESLWTFRRDRFPDVPVGDSVLLVKQLHERYRQRS